VCVVARGSLVWLFQLLWSPFALHEMISLCVVECAYVTTDRCTVGLDRSPHERKHHSEPLGVPYSLAVTRVPINVTSEVK